ncbi:hypothetical protein SteCoe_16210 [Stentor coeruleus]|uniref:Uncharacterized protein n=1 Tax=Stentor coeruleus TaxID=5963 RepID=A0A1R2C1Y3_9CILI|nr:hypothetical protein SteCoe_16210 [Stentor coeruleus]
MENKKKKSCSCFSFLRRKKSKRQTFIDKNIKNLSPAYILKNSEKNVLTESSVSTAIKQTHFINPRCSIITPLRKSLRAHRMLPSIFTYQKPTVKPNSSNNINTAHENIFPISEMPIIPVSHLFDEFKDIRQIDLFQNKIKQICVDKDLTNNNRNSDFTNEGYKDIESKRKIPKRILHTKSGSRVLKNLIERLPRKSCNFSPVQSPGLSYRDKFSQSPLMESLTISPIKLIVQAEDCNDIKVILENFEIGKNSPGDVGGNTDRPKRMPNLKPAAPFYFAKKGVIPTFHMDNKA